MNNLLHQDRTTPLYQLGAFTLGDLLDMVESLVSIKTDPLLDTITTVEVCEILGVNKRTLMSYPKSKLNYSGSPRKRVYSRKEVIEFKENKYKRV